MCLDLVCWEWNKNKYNLLSDPPKPTQIAQPIYIGNVLSFVYSRLKLRLPSLGDHCSLYWLSVNRFYLQYNGQKFSVRHKISRKSHTNVCLSGNFKCTFRCSPEWARAVSCAVWQAIILLHYWWSASHASEWDVSHTICTCRTWVVSLTSNFHVKQHTKIW